MNDSIVMAVLISAIFYGTPLLYAALGEVLACLLYTSRCV